MNREKDIAVAASRDEGDGPSLTDLLRIAAEDERQELVKLRKMVTAVQQIIDDWNMGPGGREFDKATIEAVIDVLYTNGMLLGQPLTPPKALTVNTSTPGNDLAATRDADFNARLTRLEFEVSLLKGGKE